jgi:multiple sugar transport system permease protein
VLSLMMNSIQGVDWGVLFAAATDQLLPIAILAVLAQRFIVAGLTAGRKGLAEGNR